MSEHRKLGGISVSIVTGALRPYSQFSDSELKNSVSMALSGQLKDPARLGELEQDLLRRQQAGLLPEGISIAQAVLVQPEAAAQVDDEVVA